MSSRYIVKIFVNTLLLGGFSTMIVGAIYIISQQGSFSPREAIASFGFGLLFGTMSQMAFFAYLSIHRFGLGFFRSPKLWNVIQLIVLVLLLLNILFPENLFKGVQVSDRNFILLSIFLVAISIVISFIKSRQSNYQIAFIPTIFFMVAATFIEWLPALKLNDGGWAIFMLIPLLICNSFQILILPRYLEQSRVYLDGRRKLKAESAKTRKKAIPSL